MGRSIKQLGSRSAMLVAAGLLCVSVSAQDKKLTVEQVIAHHLDSIGSAQARGSAKNRVVSGTVKLVSRVGTASNIDGQAAMASWGAKVRYSMRFTSPQYTGEQLAFDGSKVLTGHLPSGRRSPLSLYLEQQSLPLRDGLLGGSLSTAWAMLRVDQLKPKLDYKGVKKIDGRQLHEVIYRPDKGSTDLKVSLYFDAATFQHVRTEYEFRAVDALMIPRMYKLQLQVQTSTGTNLYDWNVVIDQVLHNQALDEQIFSK
jgi:hypothetical protein